MRPITTDVARSVIYVSVCVLDTRMSCAKTAKLIEMPFGGLTRVDLRNHVLDGSRSLTKRGTFEGMCRRTAMRPFSQIMLHAF